MHVCFSHKCCSVIKLLHSSVCVRNLYINISKFILFLLSVKNMSQLSDSLFRVSLDFSPRKTFVTTPTPFSPVKGR